MLRPASSYPEFIKHVGALAMGSGTYEWTLCNADLVAGRRSCATSLRDCRCRQAPDILGDVNWTEILPTMFGGALIGLAAASLLLATGKTAGVSGILEGVVLRERGESGWKLAFIIGLLTGGVLLSQFRPVSFSTLPHPSLAWAVGGGLLVGFGTRLSGGCTSGHGICGVGRLSKRSIVAMVVFTGVGMLVRSLI